MLMKCFLSNWVEEGDYNSMIYHFILIKEITIYIDFNHDK